MRASRCEVSSTRTTSTWPASCRPSSRIAARIGFLSTMQSRATVPSTVLVRMDREVADLGGTRDRLRAGSRGREQTELAVHAILSKRHASRARSDRILDLENGQILGVAVELQG